MKIKFSNDEFNYLKKNLFIERKDLVSAFQIAENTLVELDEGTVDEIRDWAGEKQQIVGFDKDYSLTPEGKLLDEIIDTLFQD